MTKPESVIREEIIGDCHLILGDCLEVMPTLGKVDACVIDPPYGLGNPSGTIGKKASHKREYKASFEDTHEYLLNVSVKAVKIALMKSSGRGIITPGSKHAWDYPKPDTLGAFYQPAATGICVWGRTTLQPILFYGRDPMIGKTIQPITYTLTEKPSCPEHPCSKPQKAWEWIVKRASLEDETILDPFMGSGTTGVACVKLGRKFIGIELEERYFNIACKRIEEAHRQPDMFIEPPKKPIQESLI